MLRSPLVPKKRFQVTPLQMEMLGDVVGHKAVELEIRELTVGEKDYVEPRLKEIEQMEYIIANDNDAGPWMHKVKRTRRHRKRQLDRFFFKNRIWLGLWQDEKGQERYYLAI